MRKRASNEEKNKAFDLYKAGNSAQNIADILGYNEATIRVWLKANGIEIRKGGVYNVKYSDELIYSVINLYERGYYTTEIDEKLNLRKGTSVYVLNKKNIEMRHRGPKSKIKREDFFDIINSEEKVYFLGGKRFSKKLYDYLYLNANIYLKRKKDRLEKIISDDGTPYA